MIQQPIKLIPCEDGTVTDHELSRFISEYSIKNKDVGINTMLADIFRLAQQFTTPPIQGQETFLQQLRRLSVERAINGFNTYDNQPITYWTTAIIGEFGELCNMIKKMQRFEVSGHDSGHSYTAKNITPKMIREEIGGTLIYIDLLCSLLKIDLEEAIIETFNEKSIELNFPYLLSKSPAPTPQGQQGDVFSRKQMYKAMDDMARRINKELSSDAPTGFQVNTFISEYLEQLPPQESVPVDLRKEICTIISRMLDNPNEHGIYPTTKCYNELEALIRSATPSVHGASPIAFITWLTSVAEYRPKADMWFYWKEKDFFSVDDMHNEYLKTK